MLYEIMRHLRNFFPTSIAEVSRFEVINGTINLPFVSEGQYFLIQDSNFNDGVYQYPPSDMTNESFLGTITVLNPPKEFLDLVDEIKAFQAANPSGNGYQSESFGGYSYSRATNSRGNIAGWQDVFGSRLNVWRKI